MLNVLIIDDDESFRMVLKDKLMSGDLGHYNIAEAGSSSEALDIYSRKNSHFDIVICDYSMPGGNGLSLIDELKGHNKDLKCLLISGDEMVIYRSYGTVDKSYPKTDLDSLIKGLRDFKI